YTVAPSYKDADTIWCGTDDGLIHVTRDGGGHWTDVTPSALTAWSKVSLIDAGRHDANTAYAAVNRFRLDDLKPHIYRTRDGGKTWTAIVKGLANDPVNVVREDPVRPGLLYCGTERAVYVSFNDGDDWQPLRLNMPCTSIRDLVVHGDDLVVGTHGRSFWILDDVSPLRQLTPAVASAAAHLFAPAVATRVRWNVNTDTPLPPEEPTGRNPPDGAIIDYRLAKDAAGPVQLEIVGPDGTVLNRFRSTDRPRPVDEQRLQIRPDWVRPPQMLSARAGTHRFVWDLHRPPAGEASSYPISAIRGDTPAEPRGPWVLPGGYTVRLKVDGAVFEQPLTVRMDPRVPASEDALRAQYRLSVACWSGQKGARAAQERIQTARRRIAELRDKAPADVAKELGDVDEVLAALSGPAGRGGRRGEPRAAAPSLGRVACELAALQAILQGADAAPTPTVVDAVAATEKAAAGLYGRLEDVRTKTLPPLNAKLRQAGLGEVSLDKAMR